MKVFVGSSLKDAAESLRERLAPCADGHGIQVLESAIRAVLINKGVTTVWRAAEDLYGLTCKAFEAGDKSSRVE